MVKVYLKNNLQEGVLAQDSLKITN
jgi:hypothetical protein